MNIKSIMTEKVFQQHALHRPMHRDHTMPESRCTSNARSSIPFRRDDCTKFLELLDEYAAARSSNAGISEALSTKMAWARSCVCFIWLLMWFARWASINLSAPFSHLWRPPSLTKHLPLFHFQRRNSEIEPLVFHFYQVSKVLGRSLLPFSPRIAINPKKERNLSSLFNLLNR